MKTDSVIEWGWGGGGAPLSKALGDLLIDWAPVPAVVTARLGDGHAVENESELACSWVVRLDSLVAPQIDLIQAHWRNGTRPFQLCCMTCTGHRNAGVPRVCWSCLDGKPGSARVRMTMCVHTSMYIQTSIEDAFKLSSKIK